jgi:Predicted spermidine synthase with an N-terminal membrane domain
MYGGAVVQYGLTIGLFFCSLGFGSFLVRQLADQQYSNFFRTELYLAIVAPVGFVFVFWLNGITLPSAIPGILEQVAARLPVVIIGVLSGFELPLLLSMVETESRPTESRATFPQWLSTAVSRTGGRVLSALFHTDSASETTDYETYSTVLAMDYLGGLAGAFVFVFGLYPRLGIIPTVFVLALLNGIAALGFAARFSDRKWGLYRSESRQVVTRERKALFLACVLITGGYAGIVINHGSVDEQLSEYYLSNLIEQEYPPDTVDVTVTEHETTQYQQLVKYEREWTGTGTNQLSPSQTETCFRLDTAIQLCESWAESYHQD